MLPATMDIHCPNPSATMKTSVSLQTLTLECAQR